jgi:alginate O-acetyltransferase complex protein AlgJ
VTERLEVSEAERRELAGFPEVSIGGSLLASFPAKFEDWFNDHFGMREGLVRWYNRIRVQWLGVSTSEWVLVGDDGWLYQAGSLHEADMRNNWPYSESELQQWAAGLGEKANWLDTQGVAYLFVITPNKHLVYPGYLPAAITRVRPDSRADQIMSYVQANTDVPIIDLTRGLVQATEDLRAYHKTDTHWNAWGAYNGYREIISSLQTRFPGLRAIEYTPSDFESEDRPGGDLADGLAMKEILREAHIGLGVELPRCSRNIGIPQGADEGVMYSNVFATECESGRARLLILRDSYAIAMIPYLAETFAHVDYYTQSPVPLARMIELVREYNPDIVIEQRSSRWLRGPDG